MRTLALFFLGTVLAVSPAFAGASYTINFNSGGSVTQATPFSRSVSGALPSSNGTGAFTGSAYAGPCQVSPSTRTDCSWANGLSGSFASWTTVNATTDDFIITGPGSSVHGTIHLRVSGRFSGQGGFPDNNAAQSGLFWFHAGSNYSQVFGQVNRGLFTISGSGWLSGVTTPSFDVDIPLEANYPVNSPFQFHLSSEVDAGCYGNSSYNPGMSQADGGTGAGVSIGSGGVVMDLPAGYTLNSVAWRVQNNVVGIEDAQRPGALRLQLASANPMSGEARFRLGLPRASRVRATVYDAMGRAVRSLLDGWQEEGDHDLRWDGRGEGGDIAAPGLYFARVSAMGQTLTARVVRVR